MIEHIKTATGAFYGAFAGVAGIAAQITIPSLPKNFESWPVTAMLALIVIVCLWIIYKQSKANADASVLVAKSLTELVSKQGTSNEKMSDVINAVYTASNTTQQLITTLQNRPCLSSALTKPQQIHPPPPPK